MSIYIVSDLHLSANRPDLTNKFFYFLDNHAKHAEAIYILGDFFAVWLGDDMTQNWQREVQAKLCALAARDIAIYIMHGNRDFLIGQDFITACNATLIQEPYQLEIYGRPTVLLHGDSLCTQDPSYQVLRRIVRNRLVQWCFLKLPFSLRQRIAKRLRRSSRENLQLAPNPKTDATESAINNILQQYGNTVLIHGHTHHPCINWRWQNQQRSLRIVLSDWDKRGNMLHCAPNNTFRLSYF